MSTILPGSNERSQCVPLPDKSSDLKEELLNLVDPLVRFADEYATVCDDVISALARGTVRLLDAITMARSPVEVLSSAVTAIPSLILSLITSILYAVFYVVTIPFRILFHILYYHPFLVFVLVLFSALMAFAFMVFVRRLSVNRVCRLCYQTVAPLVYAFFSALIPIVCPQLTSFYNTVRLIVTPIFAVFHFMCSLPSRLVGGGEGASRCEDEEGSDSECSDDDRLMCCVCMLHEKSVMVQPCNHICLCTHCAQRLTQDPRPACPLCRSHVRNFLDVYI